MKPLYQYEKSATSQVLENGNFWTDHSMPRVDKIATKEVLVKFKDGDILPGLMNITDQPLTLKSGGGKYSPLVIKPGEIITRVEAGDAYHCSVYQVFMPTRKPDAGSK